MAKKKKEKEEDAQSEAAAEGRSDENVEADGGDSSGRWPVDRLKPVVEALVFASGDAIPARRLSQVIHGATKAEVVAALAALQADYETKGCRLVEVAGGWQFRTAPEHHEFVKKLFKERPFRLTRAGIETLSIVAYKQPATRAEIEAVRGVDCSGVLESLVERRVVRIAGRRDVPGRPLVYQTTPLFLEMFGLKDLSSLPALAELGDELQAMADMADFAEGEESGAEIIPLEEGDQGADEIAPTEAGDRPQDGEEGLQAEAEAEAGEQRDGAAPQTEEDDGIPKVRFRAPGNKDGQGGGQSDDGDEGQPGEPS